MRKPRHKVPGAAYHVCARANRQELILEDNQFKLLFLQVIKEAKKKYIFQLRNFCIMGNHVHLDIIPDKNNEISDIMRWILSVFAIRYNKIFGYKGHVWYDRFKSKVIQTFQQLINTFIYIANNPVRAKFTHHPLKYKFNGITYLKNKYDPELLTKPDKKLLEIIDKYLLGYSITRVKFDPEISFQPKKPGRKSITK
jgi:putative transposase